MPLDARGQRFFHHGHGVLRRHRSLQEVAYRRTLHHLGSAVSCHVAETVRAVDYVAAGLLGIGHQKTTVCGKKIMTNVIFGDSTKVGIIFDFFFLYFFSKTTR